MTHDDKALVEAMRNQIESWEFEDPRSSWWKWQHQYAEAADRIEALSAEVDQWRSCARYDATMEGPVFKGWDRSALERCRRAALGEQQ